MTKTLKDYFKRFEDKIVGIEETPEVTDEEFREITYDLQFETDEIEFISDSERLVAERAFRYRIFKYFRLIERFIKAQHLENQRDLWLTIIDLLNDSKAFNNKDKEEIREELLMDCFKELENLNNTILQSQTQKTTTVEGNSEKANKPDEKFNWQGEQTQLVYLIEQLYEQGFLSPISQAEKHRLTAQHFTVKGESLNPRNLAKAKQSYLNNKGGKPKRGEEIEQIVSAAKKIKIQAKPKQNPRQP